MARIRSIKPEFWTSEQILECSTNARLLFIGLWNFCDDAGRHPYSAKQAKAEVFPADDLTEKQIMAMLCELVNVGLICPYSFGDKQYFYVTGWQHQRIDKPHDPKYPDPFADDSKIVPRTLPPDTIGYDRIGKDTIRKDTKTDAPNGALLGCQDWPSNHEQLFWIKYPHKVGKRSAMKALTSVRRRSKIPWAEFMAALDAYIANKPAERHWCNPATWLNQDRFEDRPGPPPVIIQTPKERMSDVLQQLGSGNFGQDLDIGLPKLVSK